MKNLFMIKLFLCLGLLCLALSIPNQRPTIGIYTQSDEDDEPRIGAAAF